MNVPARELAPWSDWTLLGAGISGTVKIGFNWAGGNANLGMSVANAVIATQNTNANSWRDNLKWSSLETSAGVFNWAAAVPALVDSENIACGSNSIDYVHVMYLGNAAVYGTDAPTIGPLTAIGIVKWQAHVSNVVNRFKARGTTHYELWNEPNTSTFWANGHWTTTDGYVSALVPATYDAMIAADPSAKLLVGSIIDPQSTFFGGDDRSYHTKFLQLASANLNARPNLRLSWHTYMDNSGGIAQITPEAKYTTSDLPTALDAIRINNNWRGWITESGWYTESGTFKITQALQQTYYTRHPFLLRCVPGLEGWHYYQMTTFGTGGLGYGLIDNSGTAKLAYNSVGYSNLQAAAATNAICYRNKNGTTFTVEMETSTGNRYALWDTAGSVSYTYKIRSSDSGTLTITSMIDGTTTTQSIVQGDQFISISIGQNAVVASADVSFTIRN